MMIALLGAGWVGLVTAGAFAKYGHTVAVYDVNPERVALLQRGEMPFFEQDLADLLAEGMREGRLSYALVENMALSRPDIIFCCVGTPQGDLGYADTSAVDRAAECVVARYGEAVFVIKSTVPPGTCKHIAEKFPSLHIASNPEFLAEGTAVRDALLPARIVFGAQDDVAREALARAYAPWVAQGVPFLGSDWVTSELAKYAANAFLATKISFVNELSEFAECVGADMEKISESMGYDPRIGGRFLRYGLGYGGSCFPKDTQALLAVARDLHVELPLVQEAEGRNMRQRNRYTEKILHAFRAAGGVGHVAILGVAYKAGTDDIRSSPAVDIAERLVREGLLVRWFDPLVTTLSSVGPREASKENACAQASVIFVATDWPELMAYAQTLPQERVIWGRSHGTL